MNIKNKSYYILYVVTFTLVVIWGWANFYPEVILIRINEKLVLTSDPYLPFSEENTFAILDENSSENYLTKCEDIKTDVIFQVKTKNGVGYIESGDYFLIRRKASPIEIFTKNDIVTSSCIGFLEHREFYE